MAVTFFLFVAPILLLLATQSFLTNLARVLEGRQFGVVRLLSIVTSTAIVVGIAAAYLRYR